MTVRTLALVALAVSCGHQAPAPVSGASLDGDIARVGGVAIPGALVSRVVRATGMPPRPCLEALVDDALAAEGARASGLDREPAVAWASFAALARSEIAHVVEESRALGPPTDDELATLAVVHAVVLRSASLTEARALATIGAIRQAVITAKTPQEFQDRALAVPHEGIRVTAEQVPGLTADGTQIDPSFVAAAFSLHSLSDTSPVVESSFGWHVLRIVERAASSPALAEQRRRDVAESVQALRIRARVASLLAAARERSRVDIMPTAEGLMAQASSRPR